MEKPVPMPEQFPAALADFTQLVIGGNNPEEKLRAFIRDQTEKFLAAAQLVFATPEQRQDGMDKWSAAKLVQFQKGFPDPDSWQSMARSRRAWTKAKNSTDQPP